MLNTFAAVESCSVFAALTHQTPPPFTIPFSLLQRLNLGIDHIVFVAECEFYSRRSRKYYEDSTERGVVFTTHSIERRMFNRHSWIWLSINVVNDDIDDVPFMLEIPNRNKSKHRLFNPKNAFLFPINFSAGERLRFSHKRRRFFAIVSNGQLLAGVTCVNRPNVWCRCHRIFLCRLCSWTK